MQYSVTLTDGKGLDLFPAGPKPSSASELSSSGRMLMLTRKLGDYFDHIFVDTSPISGPTDGPSLSRAVEDCNSAEQAECVAGRGAKCSSDRLQSVQAQVFSVTLTQLKQPQTGHGYSAQSGK